MKTKILIGISFLLITTILVAIFTKHLDSQKKENINNHRIEIVEKYCGYIKTKDCNEAVLKDEYTMAMLEDVSDIVKEYDKTNLKEIEPITVIPEIDLKKSDIFSYDIGNNEKVEVKYIKDEEYKEELSQIYLSGELMYKDKIYSNIGIREQLGFVGKVGLHTFHSTELKYPLLIVAEEPIGSSRDKKAIYFLINDELVRYEIRYNNELTEQVLRSNIEVNVYIDIESNKPYIYSYWLDPAFIGNKISRWEINHEKRMIVRESSIIEIAGFIED